MSTPLVGARQIQWMFDGLGPFITGKKSRPVLTDQPLLHLGNGKNVAIADDQIDVIERDAFGAETAADHFL